LNEGSFDPVSPQNIKPRKHETAFVRKSPPNVYAKLIDNTQKDVVSILTLTEESFHGKNYHVVKLAKSDYLNRGHMKFLFNICIHEFDYVLMSDDIHTKPGSMDVWKKAKTWEGIDTSIINVKTNYIRKYTTQEDHEIWGLSDEFFMDGKIYAPTIDQLNKSKRISEELYKFIMDNQDNLKNRADIRLIAKK